MESAFEEFELILLDAIELPLLLDSIAIPAPEVEPIVTLLIVLFAVELVNRREVLDVDVVVLFANVLFEPPERDAP